MSGILQFNHSIFIKNDAGEYEKLMDVSQVPIGQYFDLRHEVSETKIWEFRNCRVLNPPEDGEIVEVSYGEHVTLKESMNGQTTE